MATKTQTTPSKLLSTLNKIHDRNRSRQQPACHGLRMQGIILPLLQLIPTDEAVLDVGIRALQTQPCQKNVQIPFEALELLSSNRVPQSLGCASVEVRDKDSELFLRLSQAQNHANKHSLTQILVKAPVPLRISSCTTRGSSQWLHSQCSQYFNLRCRLLSSLSTVDKHSMGLVASSMLQDDVAWLANFSPYTGASSFEMEQDDNALLAGHLNVVRGLLSCDWVNRRDAGKSLIPDLLNHYLFPASKLIAEGLKRSSFHSALTNFNPKGSQSESRLAAYALIVELVLDCKENLEAVVKQLISMHHRFNPDLAKEFEYEPAVDSRASCNYVGLKNAGATCYMNSVIQQLFLIPGIKEALLSIDDEDSDEDTLFFQFQMVMGHLQDSKLQYYVPEKFWRCLRLRGQPVNVREQQDSFEFFTHSVNSNDMSRNPRPGRVARIDQLMPGRMAIYMPTETRVVAREVVQMEIDNPDDEIVIKGARLARAIQDELEQFDDQDAALKIQELEAKEAERRLKEKMEQLDHEIAVKKSEYEFLKFKKTSLGTEKENVERMQRNAKSQRIVMDKKMLAISLKQRELCNSMAALHVTLPALPPIPPLLPETPEQGRNGRRRSHSSPPS